MHVSTLSDAELDAAAARLMEVREWLLDQAKRRGGEGGRLFVISNVIAAAQDVAVEKARRSACP